MPPSATAGLDWWQWKREATSQRWTGRRRRWPTSTLPCGLSALTCCRTPTGWKFCCACTGLLAFSWGPRRSTRPVGECGVAGAAHPAPAGLGELDAYRTIGELPARRRDRARPAALDRRPARLTTTPRRRSRFEMATLQVPTRVLGDLVTRFAAAANAIPTPITSSQQARPISATSIRSPPTPTGVGARCDSAGHRFRDRVRFVKCAGHALSQVAVERWERGRRPCYNSLTSGFHSAFSSAEPARTTLEPFDDRPARNAERWRDRDD